MLISEFPDADQPGLPSELNIPFSPQIVLEATSGAWPTSGIIAVDDISYTADSNCDPVQKTDQEEGEFFTNFPD